MNSKILKIFLFSLLILLPLTAVKAWGVKTGDTVYVAKNQIINGSFYASGQSVTINGTISGDLIVIAQNLTVNGPVEGDVIALAQNITINGPIGGNVRIAGSNLTINNIVTRNVNALGTNIILGPTAHIGWDVYVLGQKIEMRGIINGGLAGRVEQALITGKIAKNLNLNLNSQRNKQNLIITSKATIGGNVIYTANNAANISNKASIGGKIQEKNSPIKKMNWWLIWLWKEMFAIFSALVVGLVLIFITKDFTAKILTKIKESPNKTLLPGLILTFILPITAIILMFTLIGIPLALIIMAGWLTIIYIAKILTAILIGQIIIRSLNKKTNLSLFWPLVVGVTISWLIFAIPFVGWILALVAIWLGLGGIWNYATNKS